MAENTDGTMENRELGPTYKSLFLAACALIGGTFGWWFTNFIADFNALSARVAALEIRDTEVKWTFRINAEKFNRLDTHEERLQILEHESGRYTKGTRRGEP